MSDTLDQLTDAELSEVFAVEVAGIPRLGFVITDSPAPRPLFATSADAVLPFLEQALPNCCRPSSLGGRWEIEVAHGYGCAPTLARAACIALLRAERSKINSK
jgi:hypothetical protein